MRTSLVQSTENASIQHGTPLNVGALTIHVQLVETKCAEQTWSIIQTCANSKKQLARVETNSRMLTKENVKVSKTENTQNTKIISAK